MPLGDTIGGYVIGQETEEQFEELLLKIFDHHNDPTYGYALKFEGTTPPTPSTTVYPPSQFFGAVKHRHHPTKKKHFILRTNWTASPTEDVSFYRVYANGRVVKQIPRSKPFSYHVHRHTHRVGKKYEITAVVITDDGKEVESPRVTLKVFDSKK